MTPKVIRTPNGEFLPADWTGKNESGIEPFGDRILILGDTFAPESSGGIKWPDDLIERMTEAAETGVLVAVGSEAWAWNSDRTRRFEGEKPEIGQRIIFERYAGQYHFGADGRRYRIMDDRCVGGLFAEDAVIRTAPKPQAPATLTKVTKPPLVAAR
jgi:co-chaperonin GroES (HSP10)